MELYDNHFRCMEVNPGSYQAQNIALMPLKRFIDALEALLGLVSQKWISKNVKLMGIWVNTTNPLSRLYCSI